MSNCICATTRPKSGTKRPNTPGLVHPAQHQLGRIERRSAPPGTRRWRAGRRAPPCRSAPHRGLRRASPLGWISSRSRAAIANSSTSRTGSARKKSSSGIEIRPRSRHEAGEPLGPAADRRQREAEALLAQLLVELGEEQAGQVADRLGVEEIELHEALDRRFSRPVGVVHDFGDLRWWSKPSRSSARPASRWRWQRTDQKKRSARSKRRNSAAVSKPGPDEVRRAARRRGHICRSSRACGGRAARPCRP